MKKWISLISVVLLIGLGVFSECKEEQEDIFKIGCNLPMTGNFAYWGEEFKRGLDLFEIPDNIKVVIEDNQTNITIATNISKKMYSLEKVDVLVSLFAPFTFSQREFSQTYKKPLISTFNSIPNFTTDYSYCYVDFVQFVPLIFPIVDYVYNELDINKGVSICINDEFGAGGAQVLKKYMQSKDGEVLDESFFKSGSLSDLRNIVIKSLSRKPDFIFVIARDLEIVSIVNYIRERNLNIPIFGISPFDDPTVWSNIDENYQNNVFYTSSYFDKNANKASLKFYNDYVERYKKDPDYPSVYAYTIIKYISTAILSAKKNGIELTAELNKVDYESIRGVLKMNENREISSPIALYTRENGKTKIVKAIK